MESVNMERNSGYFGHGLNLGTGVAFYEKN